MPRMKTPTSKIRPTQKMFSSKIKSVDFYIYFQFSHVISCFYVSNIQFPNNNSSGCLAHSVKLGTGEDGGADGGGVQVAGHQLLDYVI